MTWLKGQATQSTIADILTKLMAGEIADGVGNTCAAGDRWLRPIVGQDFLTTPAAAKVALPAMSFRAGYLAHNPGYKADQLGDTFIRQTAVSSNAGITGTPTRWRIVCRVATANTVAGDYSTARVDIAVFNADSDVIIAGISSFTPSSSGVITLSAGYGGGTLQLGTVSSGIVTTQGLFCFFRVYSTTYPGGVDFWPMLYRQQSGESSVFSVNPPGTVTTDWVADVSIPFGTSTTNSADGNRPTGGFGFGLGIKTNAALTGALYTLTFNVFSMSILLAPSGTQSLSAAINGGWQSYPVDSVYRRVQGSRWTNWLQMFTGAPLSSSVVQYWMSVKTDRVLIVINGDPGVGGVLTCAGMWKFTPDDATHDLFPWAHTANVGNYQINGSCAGAFCPTRPWPLIAQQAAANGYRMPVGRDWATGWGRTDVAMPTYNGRYLLDDTLGAEGGGGQTGIAMGGTGANLSNGNATVPNYLANVGASGEEGSTDLANAFPAFEAKPYPGDGKWYLYGHVYYDQGGPQSAGLNFVFDTDHYRGKLTDKLFYIPGTGWSSGDELTDTGTGKVYFLIAADFPGNGMARSRYNTNAYSGGVAIEEA